MKMAQLQVVFVFVCVFLLHCNARPDGLPKSACSSLTPVHRGQEVQRTASPYTVSVVRNGDKVRVRIYSQVGEEFEGFALQARSSKDRKRMIDGRFTEEDGVSRTVDCSRGMKNTLTQVNPNPKRDIVTEWTPTSEVDEDVIFRATVLKTFTTFWTEIDSSPLKISSSGTNSATSNRQNQREETDSTRMYHNCFVSKGCFGLPSGCINRRDCEVFLTYSTAPEGISFKMSGSLEPRTYMAMGLSRDNVMGEDAVTECFRDGSNIVARDSWNEGKSNTRNRELSRDKYSGDFTNGLSSCTWTAKFLSETNGMRFDLANSRHYLFVAKGPMRNDRLSYHRENRIASEEAVNFTAFEEIEAGGVSDSIKIHGITESSFSTILQTDVTEANTFENVNKFSSMTEEPVPASSTESTDAFSSNSNLSISILCILTCLGLNLFRRIVI